MSAFGGGSLPLESPPTSRGIAPDELLPRTPAPPQKSLYQVLEDTNTFVSDEDTLEHEMTLNMGPQHPATHGVLRVVLKLDGETITNAIAELGYLHSAKEKIAENKGYMEYIPYMDRIDYLGPFSNEVAWCLAAEKLGSIETPERAKWLRVIGCELARLQAHLLWMGAMVMDTGALTVFLYAFREREKLYDIWDEWAGQRFHPSHCRIGGVANDLTPDTLTGIKTFCTNFKQELRDWKGLLLSNRIFVERLEGVGYLDKPTSLALGMTGPNIRACGVPYYIRLTEPYLIYDQVDFDLPTATGCDAMARFYVRMEEMAQSVAIIEQCLEKMPAGPVRSDNNKKAIPSKGAIYSGMEEMIHDFMLVNNGFMPPMGEVYHAIEAPKGELGIHLVSRGTGSPWRAKIRTPSFQNLQALGPMMQGEMLADTVVIIGSVDPVMGEADK